MPLTERQHKIRSRGIGSSDAAAAVGMSPWKSPVQLWLEKTGRAEPENLDDREDIHFGNVLEDVVAQEFVRRRGRKVQRWNTPYQRDGFMVANVDRLIVGEDAVLECKTASAYTAGKWDEVPIHYRLQVEHQLVTAQKQNAVLAVLIGGNQYDDFEIQRSAELSEALIAKEREFWRHVTEDIAPEPQSAADVIALYPVDSGKTKIATPEFVEMHQELLAVRDEVKDVEQRRDALEERIKLFLGADTVEDKNRPSGFRLVATDASILVGPDGNPLVTWKAARASEVTNWKAAATELAAKLGDEGEAVILAHTRSKPGSRRFLVKKPKAPKKGAK